MDLKKTIRDKALELGFSDCRFTTADPPEGEHLAALDQWLSDGSHGEMNWIARGRAKRRNPQLILPGAQSAIVLSLNYLHPTQSAKAPGSGISPEYQQEQGVVARYAQYRDYHDVIGARLKDLSVFLDALTGVQSRSLWYVDTGPVLERSFAHRAGMGFVGKHTNLISRTQGNWIFLAEILTQAVIEADIPEKNRCGSCRRCLDACPTGALPKPFYLDARRCISYLTIEHRGSIPEELRPLMGQRIFGCDDCLEVCPWNRFARQSRTLADFFRSDLQSRTLSDWLTMDDTEFRAATRGTPLFRTRRSRFLRNVCVAMGNTRDPGYLGALEKAARNEDDLISEHARWAISAIAGA
jgi:epoxyqueuosine reductase